MTLQRLIPVSGTSPTYSPIVAKKQHVDDMIIGKFDILAIYAYTKALLGEPDDDKAKQRGMVAPILGAQSRLGIGKKHHDEFQARIRTGERQRRL
jgi:hypothetical protein